MAVVQSFRVDIRPYAGYSDPGLPMGAWIAQAGIVGDASGGGMFISFLFQQGDDNQVSELFSLDQISIDTSRANDADVILQTIAMDSLAINRPASTQVWRINLTNVGATLGGNSINFRDFALPIWLGSPNRVEGDGGLRLILTNVDLVFYAATLQGYFWGPRAILAEGGPRRPVGGLFPT